MRKMICLITVSAFVVCFFGFLFAEHPGSGAHEHPGTAQKSEHPGKRLSAQDIIKAIKNHIEGVMAKNNGYFPLYDEEENKDFQLKLVRVHDDKVSYIKQEDVYFTCTDFITDSDVTYDVDFLMKKNQEEKLEVYETRIHKKNGKARFKYEDNEIVPVD